MTVGPRNLITDVGGILVGNAEDTRAISGTTVILAPDRAVAAVDVRGGAPGTRETDALDPACLVDSVDAIVLSGGSVYGLAAADGVTRWLGARGRGFVLGTSPVTAPVVPAAILFDLSNGGDKAWGENPPYAALGMKACDAASDCFALGNAGAGLGARAGAYKGGLGSASWTTGDGYTVGALVAANPFGSPAMPGGTLWAAAFEQNGELGRQRAAKQAALDLEFPNDIKAAPVQAGANTTIGVVAVDAMLTPAEARRVAIMAQDGYARAVRPIHTMGDGDVIFVLATGRRATSEPRALLVSRLGSIAADCVARATARGVFEAKTLGANRSYRDAWPNAFG